MQDLVDSLSGIHSKGGKLVLSSVIREQSTSLIPVVSVVIPMRNEEEYAERCIRSLLLQTYPLDRYELIVVDGNSSDRSREIVKKLQQSHTNLRLLNNSAGIVPTSMNLGIRSAIGEIIVRADAHTVYPMDYLENCVTFLKKTGAANVGGPVTTLAANQTLGARVVAALLSNRFGVGNSQFRTSMREGYVDTVPFGAFRKELFDQVGLFNEALVRNQDNELNARIRKAGGKIYLTPALMTSYIPPSTLAKLLHSTYANSKWHIFTLLQDRRSLGGRHLAPALFLTAVLTLLALSFFTPASAFGLILLLAAYFVAALYFTARATGLSGSVKAALPLAFLLFHLSYGAGTLAGLRFLVGKPSNTPVRP